jgi:hypothetical protein
VKRDSVARSRHRQLAGRHEERGSVIILVIAILVAVGVLLGALARLATPLFASAEVTQKLNDTRAAIDAGIEHGIQSLRASILANPGAMPTLCPTTWTGPLPPSLTSEPAPSVNGYAPYVRCGTLSQSTSVTEIVLVSTPSFVNPPGPVRVFSARALVEANNFTGATTILSWKTCQDPGSC